MDNRTFTLEGLLESLAGGGDDRRKLSSDKDLTLIQNSLSDGDGQRRQLSVVREVPDKRRALSKVRRARKSIRRTLAVSSAPFARASSRKLSEGGDYANLYEAYAAMASPDELAELEFAGAFLGMFFHNVGLDADALNTFIMFNWATMTRRP